MQKASARFFLCHLSGSNLGKMKEESVFRMLPNMFLAIYLSMQKYKYYSNKMSNTAMIV